MVQSLINRNLCRNLLTSLFIELTCSLRFACKFTIKHNIKTYDCVTESNLYLNLGQAPCINILKVFPRAKNYGFNLAEVKTKVNF